MHVESGVAAHDASCRSGLGPQDGRTLSAQRAYNALVSDSPKLNPIPATVRPYYGVLTDASGIAGRGQRARLGASRSTPAVGQR